MIISLKLIEDNPLIMVFKKLEDIYTKYFIEKDLKKSGRPKEYSDLQILKCMLYKILNKIYCLRELEWSLSKDCIAKRLIGLDKVPDHSTFCLRVTEILNSVLQGIFQIILLQLIVDLRVCSIDSTPLRSSRFDSQAKSGKSTRLGWYKGYKLHCVSTIDGIPLSFKFTTANVYDSNCDDLIGQLYDFDIFVLLGDAAYDSVKLFKKAESVSIHLLTDINLRKSKSVENIKNQYRISNYNFLNSPIGQKIYKQRITIERLFSILKLRYGLENPRLYGFNRYRVHVILTLFLYLIEKLIDKDNKVKSTKFPWNI